MPQATASESPLALEILKAARPRQWIKNILLLAGLFFSRQLTDPASVLRALEGFVIFCMLSSSIYLLNDIIDREKDRLHPRKRNRPIASGRLAVGHAWLLVALAAALGLGWAYVISPPFALCSACYLLMMICYCFGLKDVFLMDTMIIAAGFVLRAVSGVIVLRTPEQGVPLTAWFVMCITFLSLFIAVCKRRSEARGLGADAAQFRPVLANYSTDLADKLITVCATATILSYTLYATTIDQPWRMLTTLPFVLYGVFRYMHLVYNAEDGEAPELTITRDRPLLICVVMWLVALVFVYLPRI